MLRTPLTMAKTLLMHQEGLRLKAYSDTTGHITIGYGRNLDQRGISEAEALHMLANDIVYFHRELTARLHWFYHLDDVRQLALISMAFNLGVDGLLEFKDMLAALHCKDYAKSALCALDSVWAGQVHSRSTEIANMLQTGELPDELK